MFRHCKNENGFTLIEMLIVLFIMGALIMILVPNLADAGKEAQQKACDANKKLILAQAETYYLEHGHDYPETIDDLIETNYLREEPVCAADPESSGSYYFSENDEGDFVVLCQIHDGSDEE